MPKSIFAEIGQVFLHHVGNTERNRFWLPQVEALPKILNQYLDQNMSYLLLIHMRTYVLGELLESGFATELQAKFNNGCEEMIKNTHVSLVADKDNLPSEIHVYCEQHGIEERDLLGSMLHSPEALHLLYSDKLTVAKLITLQPELFFAIDFTPKKK